ncbi:hypothetical protein AYO44_01830 [Planctomycetaceae bacterium SCGC AG-212-F19]|nr:hypothetical protein AYO44_01830 [Planctomycetaceae bacterium SCGC AG-212-F19]
MTRAPKGFRTVVGTALTSAALAVNMARAANRLEVPSLLPPPPTAVAPGSIPSIFRTEELLLVQQPAPKAPTPAAPVEQTPTAPTPSTAPAPTSVSGSLAGDILGSGGAGAPAPNPSAGGAQPISAPSAPASAGVVGGGEAVARASSDVGDLLGKSINALGVEVHHLSPIISDPIVRGYHLGQYTTWADGGLWYPARQGLDTIISKIDSSQIESITVIKGPFSVRYGPGFSFIDVQTLSTPRYQNGWEVHDGTGMTYKTNGDMFFGIQSIWGGNDKFGFRASYNIGTGADYRDGNGVHVPSGFNVQSYNLDFGFDLGRYTKVELHALHQEQHEVKIPGAFFDIQYLSSDAYTARIRFDDRQYTQAGIDTWFNYTRLNGDNMLPSKREQFPGFTTSTSSSFSFFGIGPPFVPPFGFSFGFFTDTSLGNNQFFGFPQAFMTSYGGRDFVTFGQKDSLQVTLGSDFGYLDTRDNEFEFSANQGTLTRTFTAFFPFFVPNQPIFGPIAQNSATATNHPVPHSYLQDPGLFLDARLPLLDNRLRLSGGARFDWATTAVSTLETTVPFFPGTTNASAVNPITQGAYQPSANGVSPFGGPVAFTGDQLHREFALWAAFATAEWDMTNNLKWIASYGMAQRPPTLTELYALNPIIGVIQDGLTTVLGQPLLAPETVNEVALSLVWKSDNFRAGLNGYYARVNNYITYQQIFPVQFVGVPSYQYINTRFARLDGAEAYAEADVRRWLTLFATAAYVQGRDLTVDGRVSVNPVTLAIVPGPRTEALPGIPPLDTHVGLRFHDPRAERRWAVEVGVRIVAPQEEVATSLSETTTAGFATGDIRTYYRPNDHWLLTAGIENFWDRNYREHLDLIIPPGGVPQGVFQPGISFYFGARLTY